MQFREKIIKILEGQTGDADKDRSYLEAQIAAYKDDEDAEAIERALTYKIAHPELYSYNPETSREYYISRESVDIYVDEAAYQLTNKNGGKKAEKMLADLIAEVGGEYPEDDEYDHKCFNTILEGAIYDIQEEPDKKVVSNIYDFTKIYFTYGYFLVENGKLDEAESAFLNANKWNPLNTDVIFELAEIYKHNKKYDEFLEWTKTGLKYACTPEALARGYRNYGFYYIERENYQLAADLFYFSTVFEGSEMADSELDYIGSKTGEIPERSKMEGFIEALEEEGIQFGPDESIISIIYDMASIFEEEGLLSDAAALFKMIYDITYDEEVSEKISEIKSRMN